jgi:hypothetical protein
MAMKMKSKANKKAKARSRAVAEKKKAKKPTSKPSIKSKSKRKLIAKPSVKKAKQVKQVKAATKLMAKPNIKARSVVEKSNAATMPMKLTAKSTSFVKPVILTVKRVINPLIPRRPIKRSQRANQYTYMKAPGLEHAFEVSDTVEVFCDHEKNRERIRGWVKGIVVQVDHKMVAVQFRSNVYLTDGWMVPDRILWYPVNSEHIRAVAGKKIVKKDLIPDY